MIEEVKNEGLFTFSLDEHDLTSLASLIKCLNQVASDAEENVMFFHGVIKVTNKSCGGGETYGYIRSIDGDPWMFAPKINREFDAVPAAETTESDGAK
jgi:hypothetical protein